LFLSSFHQAFTETELSYKLLAVGMTPILLDGLKERFALWADGANGLTLPLLAFQEVFTLGEITLKMFGWLLGRRQSFLFTTAMAIKKTLRQHRLAQEERMLLAVLDMAIKIMASKLMVYQGGHCQL
jgi:hypothetical protein